MMDVLLVDEERKMCRYGVYMYFALGNTNTNRKCNWCLSGAERGEFSWLSFHQAPCCDYPLPPAGIFDGHSLSLLCWLCGSICKLPSLSSAAPSHQLYRAEGACLPPTSAAQRSNLDMKIGRGTTGPSLLWKGFHSCFCYSERGNETSSLSFNARKESR